MIDPSAQSAVEHALCELVASQGSGILDSPGRAEGLLADSVPEFHRERNAAVLAMKSRVPHELISNGASLAAMSRTDSRFRSTYALDGELSMWAVRAWAIALNLQPEAAPQPQVPAPGGQGSTLSGPQAGGGIHATTNYQQQQAQHGSPGNNKLLTWLVGVGVLALVVIAIGNMATANSAKATGGGTGGVTGGSTSTGGGTSGGSSQGSSAGSPEGVSPGKPDVNGSGSTGGTSTGSTGQSSAGNSAAQPKRAQNSEYRHPEMSERRLTESEVASWPLSEVRYALNELCAKYGRDFRDPDIKRVFLSRDWYRPKSGMYDDPEGEFTSIELDNYHLLGRIRDSRR